ncbi:MAG: hypothetical protein ABJJ90_15150, partial [Lentilitoribacter sp.]
MIKAFLITGESSKFDHHRAFSHLKKIADRYAQSIVEHRLFGFQISVVGSGTVDITDEYVAFTLCVDELNVSSDRFLKIKVSKAGVHAENDYAGSIPFYYSNRSDFCASNIEPCVFMATGSSIDDLSPENMYGYLKYGHFIWDETAWKHIYQMLPDSSYLFDALGLLRRQFSKKTVFSSEDRCNLNEMQVADELFELNQRLVSNSLKDYDEIILPLSSGYDSRMIFAVVSNDPALKKKTKCFTYGCEGSVEVEAARRLTKNKQVEWSFVDLPCHFLEASKLSEISDIFGASLHMHG